MYHSNFSKTKNEAVYDYLRSQILDLKIKPGERIITHEIALKLSVSDILVREALKKLEGQGLINSVPHFGARVIKISQDEMEEIYIIRSDLEALATRLSCKYLTKKDFTILEKIQQRYELAIREKDMKRMRELNKRFHLKIYERSPYKGLYKMIVDIWEKSQLIRHVYLMPSSLREKSFREHWQILEALRKGEGEAAAEIVKAQKIDSWTNIKGLIDEE